METRTSHWEDGTLKEEYTVDENARRQGISREYYSDGSLHVEAHYSDGELHGRYRSYWPMTRSKVLCWSRETAGGPLVDATYERGKRTGIYREWYRDGTLRVWAMYQDGQYHGMCREWFATGRPAREIEYKDGVRDGVCRHWYENGVMYLECTYKANSLEGPYTSWHNTWCRRPWLEATFKGGELDTVISFRDEWGRSLPHSNSDIQRALASIGAPKN